MEWERVSNDELERGLAHFFGLTSAGLARACEWLIEADTRQLFLADGSPDMVQWISARFGLRHPTARQLVNVARRLQDLPELKSRFAAGALSIDQVDAISRIATPETEHELIDEAFGLSNAALDRAVRRSNAPSAHEEREAWRERWLSLQWNLDRTELRLNGKLQGPDGAIVEEAVTSVADRAPVNPENGMFDLYEARCAAALVEICSTSSDGEDAALPGITVNADLTALTESDSATTTGIAEIQFGPVIANETARRLACDAIVECAVFRNNSLVGVGRRTRSIPGWLVRHRDGGCRFPGCGRTRWLQVHHIKHWADGGPTDLFNLVLLCGYHHRFLHEHKWQIEGDPSRRLIFHRPDGMIYPPPRPQLHPRLGELVRI